jgi:glucokinase
MYRVRSLTVVFTRYFQILQAAAKTKTAPIACIGAGTGLGQCFLVPAGLVYIIFTITDYMKEKVEEQKNDAR